MTRMLTSAAGALLLLAGCKDGTPARNVTQVKVANDYSAQLQAMNPLYRNLGLWRAVRDAPERCKKVDAGAYQEDYRNMAMWTAHCTDTGQWEVFIAANGEVQVRACADAATLHLPACRPLPPAPPEPARPKAG
ncbi:MAG: hypothetical protein JWO81_2412 [Alphaproteobacteria bacterium]|nr:hypothetical protein [Alphaproteobacteria bacterium]